MKQPRYHRQHTIPLLRMRHLAAIAAVVALMVAGPLCIVWKQVYINQLSIQQLAVSDSIAVLGKQAARLRLCMDKLSATGRIETIARDRCGLEYPPASKIVIIKHHQSGRTIPGREGNFIAILRRSITGGRG